MNRTQALAGFRTINMLSFQSLGICKKQSKFENILTGQLSASIHTVITSSASCALKPTVTSCAILQIYYLYIL